ncbi:phosphoribosyl pyrophosphokinase [Glonium stellatum]|uniref:Ribose-phosphate pyrophosphokinase 1 n=1 Tax=Glonium stellatum TaxID=574774 RepID=A0A8E2EXS6_9PEZI|nr:phosphoribosyl pyrophosphokinase [Glonium stellatum]
MRHAQIFSGSSHPSLAEGICDRLGQKPGKAELKKFSNGETSVQIQTSIRDQDVFIVQSGSGKINDNVMELLIMISACKGGSAKSITAVMPYFPYSRQSKKKSHRGAITARMIANLLHVAGVNHVITIDLHASQMQGFFKCPVDNLVAEPLIARWIRMNVPNWREAVVVSKNPGGTKRVTSLADALKLSFGIVTTDRRRYRSSGLHSMNASVIYERLGMDGTYEAPGLVEQELDAAAAIIPLEAPASEPQVSNSAEASKSRPRTRASSKASSNPHARRLVNGVPETPSSPLAKSTRIGSISDSPPAMTAQCDRTGTAANSELGETGEEDGDEYTDERAKDVIHGRLVHGHIVDEDHPSPAFSAISSSTNHRNRPPSDDEPIPDNMMASFISTASSLHHNRDTEHALGGSVDAAASSEEEEEDLKNPELETTVTLVGNVKDRPVFLMDDMIDKPGSWIAAAETVVKRGGATKVYCMATHGLFGGECLEEMEECQCIDGIVVTNAFPIPPEKAAQTRKLIVLDVANLLAEAIRRNHYGESISQLFMHYD